MQKLHLYKKFSGLLNNGSKFISVVIIALSGIIYLFQTSINEFEINHVDWLFVSIFFLIITLFSWRYRFIGNIVLVVAVVIVDLLVLLDTLDASVGVYFSLFLIPAGIAVIVWFLDNVQVKVDAEVAKMSDDYERLEQNYNITKTMMEITPEMLINDDLDVLLNNIILKAVKVIPKAQAGSILILNNKRMEFRAAAGYDLNQLKKVNLKVKDIFQFKLGIFREPLIIKNLEAFHESNLGPEVTDRLRAQNQLTAKSILSCAIYFENKIYGSINLDNLEDYDAFCEDDKKYIKHLATHIEIAIKNQILVENIYKLSRFDVLTNIYTRKYHEELLDNIFQQAKQKKEKFSICTIDINNLKRVNDEHGHAEGDKYLQHFCSIVKSEIEKEHVLSRTGGDEFSIIYRGKNCEMTASQVESLRMIINENPFKVGETEYHIEFGCGIACFPDDGTNLKKLIGLSDKRMYEDKRKTKAKL